MDALAIIALHYRRGSRTYEALVRHGEAVARKALFLARRLDGLAVDREHLWQASLVHDIGIGFTRTPTLGCHGSHPYIRHGVLGREMLEREGFPLHARICERHVGCGLTREEIRRQRLPLPMRDMLPVTVEEQLVCYADKFFSKSEGQASTEIPLPEVLQRIARFGSGPLRRFRFWVEVFEPMRQTG
jgi:uncharacterized protein